MPRVPRPIDGAISDLSPVESHLTGGYRVRFRLNGIPTARYRQVKSEADELHDQLSELEKATKAGMRAATTNLPASRLRAAEAAFQLLDGAKLTSPEDHASAHVLVIAAQKLIAAADKVGKPIAMAEAYRLFLLKQEARKLSSKTMADYRRLLGPFVAQFGKDALAEISTAKCYDWVHSQDSDVARFKTYGYLYAFLNFCMGKKNPNIDPNRDKPWLTANPINFEKPPLVPKDIHSYTVKEVKRILREAKKTEALGYIVFRLFTMARFDETTRFIALGGDSWSKNRFIDLKQKRIHFNSKVYLKRDGDEGRGRYITIRPVLKSWITYLDKRGLGFGYVRWNDEVARKMVADKFGREDGYSNLLRHTAITMHIRAFKDPMQTAKEAGTSVSVIERNYMNMNITARDAEEFFALTPSKLGFR